MTFNKDEILKLRLYCQFITCNPTSFDKQKIIRKDSYLWCKDWEIIEILKYLFNGKVGYFGDPSPNRLKNNPLWSKKNISDIAEELIAKHTSVSEIIKELKARRKSEA